MNDLPHSMVHVVRDDNDTPLGFIAIHRGTKKHPAFGATRIEPYASHRAAIDDVLDLASLMSQKAALAGVPYGGGKGVLFESEDLKDPKKRKAVLKRYTEKVNQLDGRFITGSDAGVSQDDVVFMSTHSPYIVGVEEDPTKRTAEGLLGAIFVTLAHLFDDPSISGHTFAIQGVGKVGSAILELLAEEAKDIVIADIDPLQIEAAKKRHPNIRVTTPDDILFESVDILIPCALGNTFTKETAEKVGAKAIVGSANNQLASKEAGDILHERGILYAPDYVVNAGGLISVVHEYERRKKEGKSTSDLDAEIGKIQMRLDHIFKESKTNAIPSHRIADTVARLRIEDLFPAHTEHISSDQV